MELRPYQEDAIHQLRLSLAQGRRRPVLRAATGSGKTVIASTIISSAVSKDHRVLFVVDNLELVQQAIETFEEVGLKVGVMQGMHDKTDSIHKVQICTAQTLQARIKKNPKMWKQYPVGLIVVDECHVQYKSRDELAKLYPDVPFIGLSATPYAKGMGKFYDNLVEAIPMQDLIDQNYLVPFRVFAPSKPEMKGVATKSNGDWQEAAAAERYTPKIMADVVETWQKHGKGRPTIGFACNVAHSKLLTALFQSKGINAMHVDGYGGTDEHRSYREDVINRFKAGEIDVLWNVGITTKGFDAPVASCVIDARPTKSLMLHIQKWGRGLRISEGKEDCIILDHAGNTERNGFPTDPMPDSLDDGKKGEAPDRKKPEDPLPTPCSKCSYVKQPKVHICPNCGFAPEKQANVDHVDGELVEIKGKGVKKYSTSEKKGWYGGFLHIARQRGYKDGWAYVQFIKKFDHKPQGYEKRAYPPLPEVESWVKSQQIRYAKAKAKEKTEEKFDPLKLRSMINAT